MASAIAIKNLKYAEEELQNALDELEEEYYRMEDDDPNMDTVVNILEEYNRMSSDECEIEEQLVGEYEFAKQAGASAEEMDKIYNKMRVALRRIYNNSEGGILYVILSDDGKLDK